MLAIQCSRLFMLRLEFMPYTLFVIRSFFDGLHAINIQGEKETCNDSLKFFFKKHTVCFGLVNQIAADPCSERVDGGYNCQNRQGHKAEGDEKVHR